MKKSMQKLAEIYSDSKLTPGEIVEFRKLSERAVVNLLQLEGDQGTVNALCKSFEVTNQLLQLSMLKMKKENEDSKNAMADVIFSQMELLKSNINLYGK